MFEEQLKGLRQTEHRVAGNDERGDLLATVVNQLALVGGRIASTNRRWTVVGSWWQNRVMSCHQLQRRAMMPAQHTTELAQQSQSRRRQSRHTRHHTRRCPGAAPGRQRRWTQRKALGWWTSRGRSRCRHTAMLWLLLLLMIADLIAPVRLLMRRRRLMLTAVKLLLLLLTLLCRRAVRMFRTAGYGTGTAAVIGRAVHRSVVHGGSETRVPVLPTTRRDDETLRHVVVASDTPLLFTLPYHCVRPLANTKRSNVNRFNAC